MNFIFTFLFFLKIFITEVFALSKSCWLHLMGRFHVKDRQLTRLAGNCRRDITKNITQIDVILLLSYGVISFSLYAWT